ncbi:unnamed protein product [Prunus brigantina]
MKRPAQLVFIPAPGVGHIVATVEIAKQLIARDDQLFITILIMKLPFDKLFTNTEPSISHRISFVNLPESHIDKQGLAFTSFIKSFVQGHKTHVKHAVTKLLAESAQVELAGAACLGFWFHLQSLHDEQRKDIAEITGWESELIISSFINPVPAGVWPGVTRTKEGATDFIDFAAGFRQTKGILINTFRELEPHALRSLSDGKFPPMYPVGPLLNLKSDDGHVGSDQSIQKSDILEWLDDQPPSSVVFLCFGSMGSFDEGQVKEIACALEQSGQRFLWSLRQPPPKGKMAMPSDYADIKLVLPEGFLDRTAGIGKVIGWAPQVAILAHPAVGGFVSHCGWNSTLESLWCGVPIATWPLYAEQQLNAFGLVKELGLGVEIKIDYKKDSEVVVSAEEIERGIRQVMDKDSDIRARVKEISEKSKKALTEGACALEHTGLRFLWSLRQPPPKGKMALPSDYADPSGVLPQGFLDRTAKIGKVIGWAPQVDILAHSSIGGFVSHCGWNSMLESLWYGVPVATWPMYAEQQTNAFQLIKELGLAVEIKMNYRKDSEVVVSAQDIERGIRRVMEHDSVIRKRVKEMSEKSKKSLMNGGSSYSSLGRFIDQI